MITLTTVIIISLSTYTVWALLRDESPIAIVRYFFEFLFQNEMIIRLIVSCPYCMVWFWGTFTQVVIFDIRPKTLNELLYFFVTLVASAGLNYIIAKWLDYLERK